MTLLEPLSKIHFLDGDFPLYFQRTEYIEPYVMEPMAIKKMLQSHLNLKESLSKR
jgi:hypothetical protein